MTIASQVRRRLLATGALLPVAGATMAQENWPTRPIRIIVAFAPGSGNDIIARVLAPKLADALGQPVTVENRAGAGGVIGTEAVVKATADGSVFGLGTSSQLVMNPALYRNLPYDVERDLITVGLISSTPLLLVSRKGAWNDMAAFLAAARANPGRITYGSAGNGSISHIVGEAFKQVAGVDLLHVPYKGNGPAMADLLAGNIDLVFDGFPTAGPHHRTGAMRILAVNGKRHADYPDVPTYAEAGVPNYESYTWNCLVAPRATPRPIVQRMNTELNRALNLPDVRARIASFGAEHLGGASIESAEAFSAQQRARWIPAVRAMNIKIE